MSRTMPDYLEHVLQRFDAFVSSAEQPVTYPEPCGHCGFCAWRDRCGEQRLQDDHLSHVAGISRSQTKKLQTAGMSTLRDLAESTDALRIPKLHPDSLGKLRHQARLQFQGRSCDEPLFELLPVSGERRGFHRMPNAVDGDLFFGMEGNPLEEGGLEYLFGLYIDEGGKQPFKPFWAHSRDEEKTAFEQFIDWVTAHLKRYPNAHIYHYASYEETAIKRLMSQHGTREALVDGLLRNGKLIDLYKVVREAIRVSEPSYSIKNIEHFYMGRRNGDVTNAGASIVFYGRWKETGESALLEQIERYIEDDVLSTYLLRDCLFKIRPLDTGAFLEHEPISEKSVAEQTELEVRLENYRARLLADLPSDESLMSVEDQVTLLTFQLLHFQRRAEELVWWQLFSRQDMTTEELLEDIESLAGLRRTETAPGTERQVLLLDGQRPEVPNSGLMFCPVGHDGNSQRSDEEAAKVKELYEYFLREHCVDNKGAEHSICIVNILVVAPYNLQVQLVKQVLPLEARVGTVDKFQGQESEIFIVSMATSNEDYLPRDIGFLYSKNRLNVAVSRAKSLACIVASPGLTAIRCRTPQDMSLVNGLCMAVRFGAAAEAVALCE
jgi:hypothetical protein